MHTAMAAAICTIGSLAAGASAVDVYLMSSGDAPTDNAAAAALTSRGHTVTIGVQYSAFDGTVNLAGFETVYLQCNANWSVGTMPLAGQQQLVTWVNGGGRLVTSEWVVYYSYATAGGKFGTLAPIIPAVQAFLFGSDPSATYTAVTPDPAINAGLPAAFDFAITDYDGSETFTSAKPGANVYYTTSNSPGAVGLAGWTVGSGSVFSFTSTCGPDQVGDAEFGRLFSNVMGEAGSTCYPDCNLDTFLTVADFGCFQTKFVLQDPYTDCNQDTFLTVADFGCFQTRFVLGCP